MNVELNTEEAGVLIALINVAVQAKGLEAAESAIHFVKKINAAAEAEKAIPAQPEPSED